MVEKMTKGDRFNWRLPFYAAVGGLIVFLPIAIYGNGIDDLLYIFVGAPIVSLILLVVAIRKKRRQSLSVLSMLVVYCAVSWGLFKNSEVLRTAARWFLWSKGYKAAVLAQPGSANGDLKHIEWDGWGWGGNDTIVYLVFDPNDSLSAAATSHSPGKFSGVPCEVFSVRHLESHWYSVVFYTDTNWGQCN
jgi:hypothetical protein